jgi:hypothetical protein
MSSEVFKRLKKNQELLVEIEFLSQNLSSFGSDEIISQYDSYLAEDDF